MRRVSLLLALALAFAALHAAADNDFHFVILGDRTGEPQPGIYQAVWKRAAAEKPAFVLSVGDTIQGLNDATAAAEWNAAGRLLAPYRAIPLYLAPGNHDIWSPLSEKLYVRRSRRPTHYGFDYGRAHFTILDNSRHDDLPAEELDFLEADLQQHASAAPKFVVFHRPSWIFGLSAPRLQHLAHQYGVGYVVSGHIHMLIHTEKDGVTYLDMPSSGGHLRLSKKYEDGWFFGYAAVDVKGPTAVVSIKSLDGRVTHPNDWGLAGLK